MKSERKGFNHEMKLDESSGFKDESYCHLYYKNRDIINDKS